MIDDDGDGLVNDSHSGEQDSEGGGYVDHPNVHTDPLQTAFDPEREVDANKRQFAAIHNDLRQFVAICGNLRQFVAIRGNSRRFVAIHGDLW